jgi:hypothetical protein
MTPERFAELVEIYGAEPRRWPQGRRQAAIAFMEDRPEEAATILETALIRMIMESASIRAASRRVRLWRRGTSFVAVGLAGALAGALAVAVLVPMSAPGDEDGDAYAITAFSNMAQMTDE